MKARRHFPWLLAQSAVPAILLFSLLSCGAQTAATYHARADQALQSFLTKFWDGGLSVITGMIDELEAMG